MVQTRRNKAHNGRDKSGSNLNIFDGDTIHAATSLYKDPSSINILPRIRASQATVTSTEDNEQKKRPILRYSTVESQEEPTSLREESRQTSKIIRELSIPKTQEMKGCVLDPIVLTDSPPRKRLILTLKPKPKLQTYLKPHQFATKKLCQQLDICSARESLMSKSVSTKGSTFTGNQSRDMSRMINAKLAANPLLQANRMAKKSASTLPLEKQYPVLAQYTSQHARQRTDASLPAISPQMRHGYGLLSERFLSRTAQEEGLLRQAAIDYIHKHSTATSREQRPSEADIFNTNASPTKRYTKLVQPWPARIAAVECPWPLLSPGNHVIPRRDGMFTIYRDQDHNANIAQLAKYTILIKDLIELFPYSKDQDGLSYIIESLSAIHTIQIVNWTQGNSEATRRRSRSSADSTVSLGNGTSSRSTSTTDEPDEPGGDGCQVETGKDKELRQYLSASASMWQHGSQRNLADLYSEGTESTPDMENDMGCSGA